MKEKIKFIFKVIKTFLIALISFYIYRGLYNFVDGSWFFWILGIPAIMIELTFVLTLLWDVDLPSDPTTSSHRDLDIYLSGDPYRIERYEQAKRQEKLLEEQNALLREIHDSKKN